MSISNKIADRPPIANRTIILCFKSFAPSAKPTEMLATIPNHQIKGGTTPNVTNTIENASVPMDQKIIANMNLELFVLRMVRAKSLNEVFSTPLVTEYFLAIF